MVSDNELVPGKILCEPGTLHLNAGRATKKIMVANAGDRPIQVGSHYHFLEVNRALEFDRIEALGFRLDIPAGTAIRFEPGDTKEVTLVALAGDRTVYGLNNLVNGALDAADISTVTQERLRTLGFGREEPGSYGNQS